MEKNTSYFSERLVNILVYLKAALISMPLSRIPTQYQTSLECGWDIIIWYYVSISEGGWENVGL